MARVEEGGVLGRSILSKLSAPWGLTIGFETWTWLAVGIGVLLRLLEYLNNRPLYMDERSLLENLVRLPVFDFRTTLTEYQLAPPGFLVVERLMVRLPFATVPTARLIPLTCGIVSMFLVRSVAHRYIAISAVPITVGLFALDDWLIYYAVEIKQYSCDLAWTLAALLLAAGDSRSNGTSPWSRTPSSAPSGPSRRRLLALAGFGAIGVWFSFPLALVLAGVGTYQFAVAASRRRWGQAMGLAAIGLTWASSFAACYFVSHRILSKERFIWDWWDFAFLRLPPHSLSDLTRNFWQVMNVFDSPADVLTPLGVLPSAFLALGLFLVGGMALGRRWPGGLFLLGAPILLAMGASALHQYPFHGRLLIFLVPSIHLLIGEGAGALARRGGPWLTLFLGAFLLLQPAGDALWHWWIRRPQHIGYDSHGDLRPDLLDYLESQEKKAHRMRSKP